KGFVVKKGMERLKTRDFELGDVVRFPGVGSDPTICGVVVNVLKYSHSGGNIDVRNFEGGFPFDMEVFPQYRDIQKIGRDELLEHLILISDVLGKEAMVGGLPGAIAARRQHYLDQRINLLGDEGLHPNVAVRREVRDPHTGIYVLMGYYSGQGPSEHLEGLEVKPRLSESQVVGVMGVLRPKGFGRIPSDVWNTPSTSHGSLVGYRAFEVPNGALAKVVNPIRLGIDLE
ncbi:MAG: hypothetical protein KKB31_01255, partial [Nanoarchaeota archaeon]|nr:hypothetical protein [Nanoarchaeota archaeon]